MTDTVRSETWKGVKHPRVRPWLGVAAAWPITTGAHLAWGESTLAGAGLTLGAVALTATTWWAGASAPKAQRLHATISAGAGSSWIVVATAVAPWDPVVASTWAIGGAVLAGGWNIRQGLRDSEAPARTAKSESETGLLTKAIGTAKARLKGDPKVEPNKVTAQVQLAPGEITADELGHRIKQIASELRVSPTSIRVIPDPDRADVVTLVVVPEDMLKKPTRWPGPSAAGGSIADPIVIGVYEDGADAELWFPFCEETRRNATHFLTAGMNGSGKSAGQSVAIAEALTRRDVIVWAIDPSKGMQTFGPFLPYLDWVEMSMSGGEAMIDALSRVITARADALGRAGYKNWTPGAFNQLGMPYMVVWIEEAAKFFREGTEMEGLVMEARSAGISVIISLQRPSATSMPTDVREQLGGALVFGVKGSTTADMALPDDVRDAGARPEAWENRRPGYAYLVAPGVDEDRYATPLRTYLISDEQIETILAASPRPAADPVTTTAAGEAYARRAIHTPHQETTVEAPVPAGQTEDEHAMEQQLDRDIDNLLDDEDTGPDPHVDPDQEIPPVPVGEVWSFGQPPPAVEDDDHDPDRELMLMLDEFREQGMVEVGPKEFQPHGPHGRYGRSRAWLSRRLTDLADAGIHLAETERPGVYRLLYPEVATSR